MSGAIRDRLAELIHTHEPDCCALESVIYVQSYKTAILLGAARGAAILAAAERGLPVFEYAPTRIKQATVGRGGADKSQVAFMIRALLGLTETPTAGRGGCARDRIDAPALAGSRPAWSAQLERTYEDDRFRRTQISVVIALAGPHELWRRAGVAGKDGRGQAGRPLAQRRAAFAGARAGLHDRPHAGPIQPAERGATSASAFPINRGGQATYHGPGQLIGYPIIDLRRCGQDLHRYLRWLEALLIETLAEVGIAATTRPGLTGVWVEDRKIASIGVGVRHWITMHGFALNVCGDLSPFEHIVPCGIANVTMTSIERETGTDRSVSKSHPERRKLR